MLSVTQFIIVVAIVITAAVVETEVLTAVVMKSSIFWDITPCSPLKVNRCFRRTSRASACYLPHVGFLLGVFFNPEDGGNMLL
jgi:hypothetical protein